MSLIRRVFESKQPKGYTATAGLKSKRRWFPSFSSSSNAPPPIMISRTGNDGEEEVSLYRLNLNPKEARRPYRGTTAILIRADAEPLDPSSGLRGAIAELSREIHCSQRSVVPVVCKQIGGYSEKTTGEEDKMMAKANNIPHDNVLAYLGTAMFEHENKPWAWMVVPDMPGGDLRAWLVKNDAHGEPETCLRLLRDVLEGLAHLHDNDVVHGDMKTNNVFLWRDNSGKVRAKIGDFGLSREASKVKPEGLATAPGLRDSGSKRFLPPEHVLPAPVASPGQIRPEGDSASVMTERGRGLASKRMAGDMWAFGMIILSIASRTDPWAGLREDGDAIPRELATGNRPRHPGPQAILNGVDFVLWRIARDCWRLHPHHRPTAHEALQIWEDTNSKLINPPRAATANPGPTHLFPEQIGDSPAGLLNITQDVTIAVHSVIDTRAGCVELNAVWREEPRSRGQTAVRLLRPADNQPIDGQGWSDAFRDDVTRWRRVQHENLLPLYGICEVEVNGVFQWHAVVPLNLSFVTWTRERLNSMRYIGHTTARPWIKLLLDIAQALQFLHNQNPPIIHGAVDMDHIFCPSPLSANYETDQSLGICLGGYRTMRTASNRDVSGDIRGFAALAREVMSGRIAEAQAAGQPGLKTPPGLDAIIERCAAAEPSSSGGAINVARDVVGPLVTLLSALPLHHQ